MCTQLFVIKALDIYAPSIGISEKSTATKAEGGLPDLLVRCRTWLVMVCGWQQENLPFFTSP